MSHRNDPSSLSRSSSHASIGSSGHASHPNRNDAPPTLDLHGCRLPTAISRTTTFLSNVVSNHARSCPYARSTSTGTSTSTSSIGIGRGTASKSCQCTVLCTIVTGSGSHSTSGPILRSAIAKLLTKRQMQHSITPNSGRGSFTVDANSGIELYWEHEGRRVDSKVVIKGRDNGEKWPDLPSVVASRAKEGGGTAGRVRARPHDPSACVGVDGRRPLQRRAYGRQSSATGSIVDQEEEEEVVDVFPLPAEVSADDAVLSHIKMMSAKEIMAARASEIRERNMLEEAMEQSKRDSERVMEMEDSEMVEMERVLKLSREESMRSEMEGGGGEGSEGAVMDDEEFEKLLEDSRREEMERRRAEEEREKEELERVLRLSDVDHVVDGNVTDEDDDEEQLKRALSLSVMDTGGGGGNRQSSAGANNDDDNDEIARAIRESLAMASEDSAVGLDGIEGDGRLDDEEAEMIRRAMELSVKAEEERRMLEQALAGEGDADTNTHASIGAEVNNTADDATADKLLSGGGQGEEESKSTYEAEATEAAVALGEPPPSLAPHCLKTEQR